MNDDATPVKPDDIAVSPSGRPSSRSGSGAPRPQSDRPPLPRPRRRGAWHDGQPPCRALRAQQRAITRAGPPRAGDARQAGGGSCRPAADPGRPLLDRWPRSTRSTTARPGHGQRPGPLPAAGAGCHRRLHRAAITVFEDQTARLRARSRGGVIGEMFTSPRSDVMMGGSSSTPARRGWPPGGAAGPRRRGADGGRARPHLAGAPRLDGDGGAGPRHVQRPHARCAHPGRRRDGALRRRIDWRRRSAEIGLSPAVPGRSRSAAASRR